MMESEFESGDIVAILNESNDVILDSIGYVSDPGPIKVKPNQVRVNYYETSVLYPNWFGVHEKTKLVKLTAKQVYHYLGLRHRIKNYKTFEEVK